MKVLMFGWEFPPHISGGLGTACYGLTKGLTHVDDLEVTFVVPKAHGDEDKNVASFVGAEDVEIDQELLTYQEEWGETSEVTKNVWTEEKTKRYEKVWKNLTYLEIDSLLRPYMTPEEYDTFMAVHEGKIDEEELEKFHFEQIMEAKKRVLDSRTSKSSTGKRKFKFSGKYGKNLMEEVSNYSILAAEIAKSQDFDIIHAHDWLTYAAGVSAKQATGKPLVVHMHATEFDRTGQHVNQQVYDIERMGMEAADMVIAVSNLTRNTVIEKYGIPADKVVTVYNAVEPVEIKDRPDFRKTVDEKIVTFLGRITYQKGPEYFIETAYQVLQRVDNVRFVMAGSGDLFRKMIRRAAQLKIMDRFHFTNFLRGDDVTKMFAQSDVYVMPSISEPFGISPLEAMRTNVPTIISKQSGVAEILKHAIKVNFWDVDATADAIHGLLKYDGLANMFKKHGKTEVDNLKWENAARHVKDVYDETLRRFNNQ